MIDDHCIVTKYELSTKEKQLKNSFFKANTGSNKIQNTEESKVNLHLSNNASLKTNPQMEEFLSKALNEETNKRKVANMNQFNPVNQSNMPLNLIYSQNKILERNVDILHETQRSIHDLLVYNIKSNNSNVPGNYNNSTNKLKEELIAENRKMLQEFIAPLYENLNVLKANFNSLMKDSNPTSELNNKVQDMIDKHNGFKEINGNIRKTRDALNLVEKNKNFQNANKDNHMLKAIEDIKGTVSEITANIGKMETDFNDNMKKMIENQERKNLMNIINSVGNKNESKKFGMNNNTNHSSNLPQFEKKNNLEEFNYQEFKNDMVDILNEKDKLFSQFLSSKLEIPHTKLTEKINFTYKVDHDVPKGNDHHSKSQKKESIYKADNPKNKTSKKMNQRTSSQTSVNNKELANLYPKKEKNVFLDNYMSYSPHDNNVKNQQNNYNNNDSVKVAEESKYNNYNKSGIGSGGVILENNRSGEYMDQGGIKNNCSMKSNLSNFNINDPKRNTSNFPVNQINVNDNSTPSTNKHLLSSNKLQTVNKSMNNNYNNLSNNEVIKDGKLAVIEEDSQAINISNDGLNTNNQINKMLKLAEEEAKKISSNANRKGITEVEVTSKEREKTNIIHDIITKLCIEKIMKEKKPAESKPNNLIREEKIEVSNNPAFPFKCHDNQIYSISENIIRDKISRLLKGKNKDIKDKDLKEGSENKNNNLFKETIAQNPISFEINIKPESNTKKEDTEAINLNYQKLQDEICKRDIELDNKMKLLYDKLDHIDTKMKENKEKKEIDDSLRNVNHNQNINVDEIINKLKSEIKDNMHININVQQPPQIIERKEFIPNKNPSFILENFDLEIEKQNKSKINSPSKRSVVSNYSHPFARSGIDKKENYDNLELANPYYYNLEEYEVSSESLINSSKRNDTEQSRTITNQINNNNYNNSSYITEQTLSDGQIPNTKRSFHNEVHLQRSENSSRNQQTLTEESSSENDDQKRYNSAIRSVLQNLNPKNEEQMDLLKKLNLYDSDEHKKFQAEFLQRIQDSQRSNQISNNLTSNRNNNNLYASFGNMNNFTNFVNSPQINVESSRSNGFNNAPIYKLPKLNSNSDIEIVMKRSNEKQMNIHTITEGESESNVTNNNDHSLSSISQKNK